MFESWLSVFQIRPTYQIISVFSSFIDKRNYQSRFIYCGKQPSRFSHKVSVISSGSTKISHKWFKAMRLQYTTDREEAEHVKTYADVYQQFLFICEDLYFKWMKTSSLFSEMNIVAQTWLTTRMKAKFLSSFIRKIFK